MDITTAKYRKGVRTDSPLSQVSFSSFFPFLNKYPSEVNVKKSWVNMPGLKVRVAVMPPPMRIG